MRKIVFILAIVSFLVSCGNGAQNGEAGKNAAFMYFTEESHDFGNVKEGDVVSYTFKFENRGDSDLIIQDVRTSCGCTVAKFDKQPIKKGKSGSIELRLNTLGKSGKVEKTASIISNASPKTKDLKLHCVVSPNK